MEAGSYGERESSDAHAELYILGLVAGVGVEVVGCAAVELVALAELAADDDAERERGGTGGDPADGTQNLVAAVRCTAGGFIDGFFDLGAEFAEGARPVHVGNHNAGSLRLGNSVLRQV
jgi:hypothetical protein